MKELVVLKENTVVVTEKDVAVARLLASDAKIAQIAQKLNKNPRTTEALVSRIKAKYGVKTLQGLVGYFYDNKLV